MFVIDEKRQADSRSAGPSSSRTFSLTFLFRYYTPRRCVLFVLLTRTYFVKFFFSFFFASYDAVVVVIVVGEKNAVVVEYICLLFFHSLIRSVVTLTLERTNPSCLMIRVYFRFYGHELFGFQ